jgi:hypothetical protein
MAPVDQLELYSPARCTTTLTGHTVQPDPPTRPRAHNGSIKTPSSLAAVPAPVEAVIGARADRSPTKRFLTVRQFVDEVGRTWPDDPRATQALGAGRPGQLVQTLLGCARPRGGSVGRGGPGQSRATVTGTPGVGLASRPPRLRASRHH